MAKKEKEVKYVYPSRFGSHKSMMVKKINEKMCVCEDEFGQYETEISRLDNGLADHNRCAKSRLSKLFSGKKEKT